MRYLILALALSTGFTACASGGSGGGGSGGRNLITFEEIQRVDNVRDAYELVRLLRPLWLQPRGTTALTDPSASLPIVYVDEIQTGRPEVLRQIISTTVQQMQFIDRSDAEMRYGAGHPGGIIMVRTR
jgi:hypothetical protein